MSDYAHPEALATTGWVAEHKSVVALQSNARSDTRFKKFSGLVEDTYEAFLSIPLVSSGEVIGVINVHHREEHAHSPHEVSLLTFVGEQMGTAIAKAFTTLKEPSECSLAASSCCHHFSIEFSAPASVRRTEGMSGR